MLTYERLGNNGGLGNQLFQLFSTIGISRQQNKKCSFPYWPYLKYTRIPEFFFSNLSGEDLGILFYQDYNYFLNIENEILEWFQPHETYLNELQSLKNKYFSENDFEYIGICVRRGDYLKYPNIFHVQNETYYKQSANFLRSLTDKKLKKIVFSDDIKWCQDYIEADIFEDISDSNDIIKLFLISNCDHFILSNSTYHWWAGYISNKNKQKIVIYPINWFKGVKDSNTFNLFYPKWYGINMNGEVINSPDSVKVNFINSIG